MDSCTCTVCKHWKLHESPEWVSASRPIVSLGQSVRHICTLSYYRDISEILRYVENFEIGMTTHWHIDSRDKITTLRVTASGHTATSTSSDKTDE